MKHSSSRRRFLLAGALAGGGLLVGYGLFKPRDLLGSASVLPVANGEVALNAWLKLAPDGRVTVAVPRAEMGQGVYTALAMLVAEELDVPWASVTAEQAPIAAVYGNVTALLDTAPFDELDDSWLPQTVRWSFARVGRALAVQVTGGSSSVRDAWLPMRSAGAAARAMLIQAAAARLEVAPDDLHTDNGRVIHAASGRSVAFGELAAEAAHCTPPAHLPLKDLSNSRHLGQARPRLDLAAKCDGSARFGIDTRQPGMLYAAVKASPVFGGHPVGVDTAAFARQPGVVDCVVTGDAVIVIADSWWRAQRALDQTPLTFEGGDTAASDATLMSDYAAALDAGDGYTFEDHGDAQKALTTAGATISAEYQVPLLAHACLEPMNCTARLDPGGAEIWCGNQAPDLFRMIAARFLDLETSTVVLHTPYLGGGFGRRLEVDALLHTLAAARALPGRCVQLIYSRAEDLQHDMYRPSALSRFRARLAADGHIAAWANDIASPSVSKSAMGRLFPGLPLAGPDRSNIDGAAFLPYATANRRVRHASVPVTVPVGYWRSVGHSFNAFFTECFMDELALAADQDPLAFRLALLDAKPRHREVLEVLARTGAWSTPPAPGRALGLAMHESFHSIVGQLADLSVVDGAVRVHRVVCVIDCGQVVNPDTVVAQMESGIVFGLTAALDGAAPLIEGRIALDGMAKYPLMTIERMPTITTVIIDSLAPPGGVGEPGTPPIAPAVANAVSRLTGKRIRRLPIRI